MNNHDKFLLAQINHYGHTNKDTLSLEDRKPSRLLYLKSCYYTIHHNPIAKVTLRNLQLISFMLAYHKIPYINQMFNETGYKMLLIDLDLNHLEGDIK
jgi:hypothetical protein